MKPYELSHRHNKYRSRSRGFTLIEILVAIVVLSFGLLGMVGIQALALKSNNDAKQQSVAVQMATELSDMMRGNKNVAILTTYGTAVGTNPYLVNTINVTNYTTPGGLQKCFDIGATKCLNPTQVAQWEIDDWLTRMRTQFVGAQVQVCYDSTPYNAITGLPQWGCAGAATPGNPISIKIGWIRASTNSDRSGGGSAFDSAVTKADGTANSPSVVYSFTPGNPT